MTFATSTSSATLFTFILAIRFVFAMNFSCSTSCLFKLLTGPKLLVFLLCLYNFFVV